MRPILTPAEASALDASAEERGVAIEWLMENAGTALARVALDLSGGAYGRRVVVACGKGNNGGDGAVAARILDRAGVRSAVCWIEEPLAGGLAAHMRERLASETTVREIGLGDLERSLDRADLVIDAIFGTGFHGAAEGQWAEVIDAIVRARAGGAAVVSADIASGVDGSTGAIGGPAVRADVTVAFGALKPGNVLHPGAANAGSVDVADIGFPPDLVDSGVSLTELADVAALLPHRKPDTHKRETGSVLVVAGSRAMSGAAALVAEAAYRAGAGLVTVATAESAVPLVAEHLTEAVFLPLPETAEGEIAPEAGKVVWDRLGDFGSFAIGPGLGRSDEVAAFVRDLAVAVPGSVVLDADGLNAFAGDASFVTDKGARHMVLTPHAGEFARLAKSTAEAIEADRIASVRDLAAVTQSTVLLKGTRTVIGSYGMAESALDPIPMVGPDGEVAFYADRHPDPVRINPTGSAFLATAGSGDVLTGTIAAMLARGLSGFDAATVGAYVHGLAGELAGESLGEGAMAMDVARSLPQAIEAVWEAVAS